jgi:hypothetical protein
MNSLKPRERTRFWFSNSFLQGSRKKARQESNPISRSLSKTLLSSSAESIQECFLSMIERFLDIPESGKVLIYW